MTIRHRLSKLEREKLAAKADFDGRAKLLAHLNSIGERLRASGNIQARLDASPAERVTMAWERGDVATAKAILSAAVGRGVTL